MEELILKMHEETLEMQRSVSEMSCMISQIAQEVCDAEVERAGNKYYDRDNVKDSGVNCQKIRRILGMGQDICEKADKILKEREGEGNE